MEPYTIQLYKVDLRTFNIESRTDVLTIAPIKCDEMNLRIIKLSCTVTYKLRGEGL